MITSDSTVEHLADSFQGLPDAHTIVKSIKSPKNKLLCARASAREPLSMRERERERERDRFIRNYSSLNGGSREEPAHGLRITTLWCTSPHTLGGVSDYIAKTFLGL